MKRVHEAYNYRRLAHRAPGLPISQWPNTHMKPVWVAADLHHALDALKGATEEQREKRLLQMGKAERALRYLPAETRHYTVSGNAVALRRNEMGLKYVEMGDLPRAFRNFTEAIAQDPRLEPAYNNIGMLYMEIGDLERAEHHLAQALAINEDLDIAHGNLGLVKTEKGEYEAAYRNLEYAIRLSPMEPLHYNNMGVLLLEVDLPHVALGCFDQAITLDAENPIYRNNRGLTYNEMGMTQEATQDFLDAISLEEKQFQAAMSEATS